MDKFVTLAEVDTSCQERLFLRLETKNGNFPRDFLSFLPPSLDLWKQSCLPEHATNHESNKYTV